MAREYRAVPLGEVRSIGERQFEARICSYGKTDSYGSVWSPGCFSESLRSHLPKVVFSHDWNRPIGSVTDYRDGPDGLEVTVSLADFDAVPDARMVHSLLRDGHLDQFSFGFERPETGWRAPTTEERSRYPGVKEIMERVVLQEASPVLIGAVPETKTLAVRSAPVVSPAAPIMESSVKIQTEHVVAVAELLRAGVLDRREARHFLETGEVPSKGGHDPAQENTPGDGVSTTPPAEEPDPGHPTPSEPGKFTGPPPVSKPGDGVAVSDDETAEGAAENPSEDAQDALHAPDTQSPPEDADTAEQERERALALATISTRGRRF